MLTEIISFQKIKELAEEKAKAEMNAIYRKFAYEVYSEAYYEELKDIINQAATKTRIFKKRLQFIKFKKESGIEAEKIASDFKLGCCNMFLVK